MFAHYGSVRGWNVTSSPTSLLRSKIDLRGTWAQRTQYNFWEALWMEKRWRELTLRNSASATAIYFLSKTMAANSFLWSALVTAVSVSNVSRPQVATL